MPVCQENIRQNVYPSLEACAKDVRTVWTNAYLYNPVSVVVLPLLSSRGPDPLLPPKRFMYKYLLSSSVVLQWLFASNLIFSSFNVFCTCFFCFPEISLSVLAHFVCLRTTSASRPLLLFAPPPDAGPCARPSCLVSPGEKRRGPGRPRAI